MRILYQVDAFAHQPFSGNPAGICPLPQPADDAWMQNVGMEMNLSETAFFWPEADGYRLRWFTPACEVDLCGHATLASAHILWETGLLALNQTARFYTRSGLLTCRKTDGWIEMDFPAQPAVESAIPPGLTEALGVPVVSVAKYRMDTLVELDSEETVRRLQPDFSLLAKWPTQSIIVTSADLLLQALSCLQDRIPTRGIIVTARSSSSEFDFVSRFFAPAVGVAEDPVTGSAHCCLGPYWSKKLNKTEFIAYQASKRGGVVRVRLHGDRVLLSGQAVTVLKGEWVG